MSGTYDVVMGDRGRLVVPVALRRDMGWDEGRRLHLVETDIGVVVMTREQLLTFVRADWQGKGAGLLDELFADRRAEAATARAELGS